MRHSISEQLQASPALIAVSVFLTLVMEFANVVGMFTGIGHEYVKRDQLDRVWEAMRHGDEVTLDTARKEMGCSCK